MSTDSGANYGAPLAAAAIDGVAAFGAAVTPGTGKILKIKLAVAGLGNRFSRQIRFQVQADDAGVSPTGFALIGSGNSSSPILAKLPEAVEN